MFCKEAQLERLNLELFQNVSVYEFYCFKALITLEQVNTTEWSEKKIRILISKTWMVGCCIYFHCMQMGLVKSMRFFFGASSETQGQIVGAKSKRVEKYGTKKSKERQEEPLGTMSYQTSSKRSPPF